jgi:hypothetical protein
MNELFFLTPRVQCWIQIDSKMDRLNGLDDEVVS